MNKLEQFKADVNDKAETYGYKAANLLALINEGIEIPPILPLAHSQCMRHLNQYAPNWITLWETFKQQQGNATTLKPETHKTLHELRQLIKQTFSEHPLPQEYVQSYLDNNFTPNDLLMVRSTGMEDSDVLANPGGNKSFSGIKPDVQAISAATGGVIASYFSEKSLEQRLKSGIDSILNDLFMPVLLQKMVGETQDHMVSSGVMYTSEQGIHIQAAPGHGELVVNSKGLVDSYFVTQMGVIHQQIYEKDIRMVRAPEEAGKLIAVQNSQALRNQSSLPPPVIQRIAGLGKQVQALYGAPRDIEFVYDALQDRIYLVQARPIPKDKEKNIIPQAISPQKIKELKQTTKEEKRLLVNAKTISPGGHRAQDITNSNQILISNTIKQALDKVLQMDEATLAALKTVIIQTDSPPTSHEAAEFNALGKAVLFVSKRDANRIEKLLKSPPPNLNLIVDPQRKLIIDWSNKNNAIFKDGLFKSAMPVERTIKSDQILFGSLGEQTIDASQLRQELQSLIAAAEDDSLATEAKKRNLNPYPCLLDLLEDIEGIDQNADKIKTARKALGLIVKSFACLANPNPMEGHAIADRKKELYFHACAYALDIHKKINDIAQSSQFTLEKQQELLDLVNGLEALMTNPGRKKLFSDSLYQIEFEKKASAKLQKEYAQPFNEFSPEIQAQVLQLYRLGQLAANEDLRNKWTQYILGVAKYGQKNLNFEKLLCVAYFAAEHEVGSALINNVFSKGKSIDEMFKMAKESQQLLEHNAFWRFSAALDEWETKISLWDIEEHYEKTIGSLESSVQNLVTQLQALGDLNTLPTLSKAKVLRELARLTEIIDVSIKTMKGSRDYLDGQEKAKKFGRMLSTYHQLMDYVLSQLPPGVNHKRDMSVYAIRDSITQKFKKKKDYIDVNDLVPSKDFSVDAATIMCGTSFNQAFISRKLNLDDYYTLFHQNIMEALSQIGKELNLSMKILPPFLQAMDKELRKSPYISLTSSEVKEDHIVLVYNIPLQNHALQLYLSFDKTNNTLEFVPKVFGGNRGGRVAKIAGFLNRMFGEFLPEFFNQNVKNRDNTIDLIEPATAISYSGETLLPIDQGIMGILQAKLYIDARQFKNEHALLTDMIKLICEQLAPHGSDREMKEILTDISFLQRNGNLAKKIDLLHIKGHYTKHNYPDKLLALLQSEQGQTLRKQSQELNKIDFTPLMITVESGDIDAVQKMLTSEDTIEEVNELNDVGDSAFSLAAWHDHLPIVELLIPFATPRMLKKELMAACEVGDDKLVALLIKNRADIHDTTFSPYGNYTTLMIAAMHGHDKVVQVLLQDSKGQDLVNYFHNFGITALEIAIQGNYPKIVELLLPWVKNLNDRVGEYTDYLPLMYAAQENKPEIVSLLLSVAEQYDIDIDAKNSKGETALMHAVSAGNLFMVRQLVTADANPGLRNKEGKCPIDYAGEHSEIKTWLQSAMGKKGEVSSRLEQQTVSLYDALKRVKDEVDMTIGLGYLSFFSQKIPKGIHRLRNALLLLPNDIAQAKPEDINDMGKVVWQILDEGWGKGLQESSEFYKEYFDLMSPIKTISQGN